MFITDRFIFIHLPKTGGTFVTRILEQYMTEQCLLFKKLIINDTVPFTQEKYGQHGGCNEIPPGWERGRTIVSIMRNPFDWYVSQYEFGWWKNHPLIDPSIIRKSFPEYPELSFERYIEMRNTLFLRQITGGMNLKADIGTGTVQFIRFFFKNPYEILSSITDEYIESGQYRKDMHEVHFLRTERLNSDLYNFLVGMGYSPETLGFILDAPKINPVEGGRSEDQKWELYYSQELKEYVREKEKLLFSMFPDYDNACSIAGS